MIIIKFVRDMVYNDGSTEGSGIWQLMESIGYRWGGWYRCEILLIVD